MMYRQAAYHTVWSFDPDTAVFPSLVRATLNTASLWPSRLNLRPRVLRSHTLRAQERGGSRSRAQVGGKGGKGVDWGLGRWQGWFSFLNFKTHYLHAQPQRVLHSHSTYCTATSCTAPPTLHHFWVKPSTPTPPSGAAPPRPCPRAPRCCLMTPIQRSPPHTPQSLMPSCPKVLPDDPDATQ